jgi:AcrR family transcriptional regulator
MDVALTSYHFGNKQGLLEAVVMRHEKISIRARRAADAVLAAQAAARRNRRRHRYVHHPLLDRSSRGSPGWNYFALIAEVNNSPEVASDDAFFDPVVDKFIDAIRRALRVRRKRPSGLHPVGADLTFAGTGRIDRLSGGACRSSDLDSVHSGSCRIAPPASAPMRASAHLRPAGTRKPRKLIHIKT